MSRRAISWLIDSQHRMRGESDPIHEDTALRTEGIGDISVTGVKGHHPEQLVEGSLLWLTVPGEVSMMVGGGVGLEARARS